MALLDFFKKRKKGLAPPKSSEQQAGRRDGSKSEKSQKGEKKVLALKASKSAWRVLRAPHVTEKSTNLTALNQYVFKMLGSPAKPEVKKAIEEIYGVNVLAVRKIAVPRKKRRRGRRVGWRPGYTKAIVSLRAGQRIEVLPH